MSETVKPRTYRSSVREEQARRTRLAILDVNSRLAPLHLVLRDAAAQAPELGELWTEIATRRAANMRLFAQDLAATGPVSARLGQIRAVAQLG